MQVSIYVDAHKATTQTAAVEARFNIRLHAGGVTRLMAAVLASRHGIVTVTEQLTVLSMV
jgi:hypothetical protein